jgi:hypothetical protein
MIQCADCHYFAPYARPSRVGVCYLQLPPWAQTHEDTDRTVSDFGSCSLGRAKTEDGARD